MIVSAETYLYNINNVKIPKIFIFIVPLFILAVALILQLPNLLNYNIPFTYDHGLTFLEVRNMVILHKFRLIGPEGGIKGIFFGPTWYYLIAIPFYLLKEDPRSGALVSLLIYLSSIPVSFIIGNKINFRIGLYFSLFFAFSPFLMSVANSAFVVTAFPLINLLALWFLLSTNNRINLYLTVFLASLSFHFEPVVAVGFNLTIFYILYPKILKLKNKVILLILWIIPFVPQIIFDLKHNFLQTSEVFSAILKSGKDLGGNLPLWQRLYNRPFLLIKQFNNSIGNGNIWLTIPLLIYFILGLKSWILSKNKYIKNLGKHTFILFFIPFLYYIFLFLPGIKPWYFFSFIVFYIIFICLGLTYNFKNKSLRYLSLLMVIIFIFVNINPIATIKNLINPPGNSDPSIVRNELAAIEWIYRDAGASPFAVYTYTPAIYDYPYQYLIWWYAWKNKLPYPKDFAYKPGTYDYVPNKLSYVPSPETSEKFTTYLIIHSSEPGHNFWTLNDFMEPFVRIPIVEEKLLAGGIRIQKRK